MVLIPKVDMVVPSTTGPMMTTTSIVVRATSPSPCDMLPSGVPTSSELTIRADARDEAIAADAVAAAVQQEVANARVAEAMREALYMLGLNLSQHDLINAVVAAATTGSSVFPRMVLPDSPRASACTRCPTFTSTHRPPASSGSAHPR
ncbi:hypothetical protein D1007_26451 [Hordeum vulgare]|nr:hypothetical protein D1007_26451 [Hordeum vulgare]